MFGSGKRRGLVAALGAVIACLLAAGTAVVLTHSSAQATGARGRQARAAAAAPKPSGPFRVLSVSPAGGTRSADGAAPVRVTFSAPVAAGSPMPQLRPAIPGSWKTAGRAAVFTPQRGFGQHQHVRLRIPGGAAGIQAAGGQHLAQASTVSFRTGAYSGARLAELLAQLGYLPLTWAASGSSGTAASTASPAASGSSSSPAASGSSASPAASGSSSSPAGSSGSGTASAPAAGPAATLTAERSAAFDPPAGTFSWKPGYPHRLHRMWHGGKPGSLIIQGAVRAFEADHGMIMDGTAGPLVWKKLFTAAVRDQRNHHGYTYALARQNASPETLTVWHNGRVIFRHLANTGIPASLTDVGTFPVYLRYQFQIMKGTNPDGSHYADPVAWVAYFSGGDAVHYFPRYSYGSQQSLGCVELPYGPAKHIWPYLSYGTLVTVTPL